MAPNSVARCDTIFYLLIIHLEWERNKVLGIDYCDTYSIIKWPLTTLHAYFWMCVFMLSGRSSEYKVEREDIIKKNEVNRRITRCLLYRTIIVITKVVWNGISNKRQALVTFLKSQVQLFKNMHVWCFCIFCLSV